MLRMADDDWDPDLDFPGLDSSAVITDVGVDQFVLCHQVRPLSNPMKIPVNLSTVASIHI